MKWTLSFFLFALGASAVLYTFFLNSDFLPWFGVLLQLLGLVLAVLNLNIVRSLYRHGDEPRNAWAWFTIGAILWTIAQILDIYREMILRQFPTETISDIFWLAGYLPYIIGMILLIRNFLVSGLPSGGKVGYVLIACFSIVLYFVIFKTILVTEFNDPEKSSISKFLSIGYPALDVLLIGMSAALVQVSWVLRGGNLSKSWLLLCAGFALGAVADLIYGRLSDIESTTYRYLDLLYFSSYFFMAMSARIQIQMLRVSASR